MSPYDIGSELTRYAPYLLVIMWAVLIALLRGRRARAQAPPPPEQPARRPQPVARRAPPAVPPPIAAAYAAIATPPPRPAPPPAPAVAAVISEAAAARAAGVARIEALALAGEAEAAAERRSEVRLGTAWQRAIVLAEIVGPPLALRRPGTLGAPGTF